jgi:ubiquinone/menaquinone biosynthesis C-methylase UbiE
MFNLEDTGERLIPEKHMQSLTYGEHLARYYAAKQIVKNKTILDIASGAGYGTAILAESAKKVYGIDYSNDAIKYAKSLYKKENLQFLQGDASNIPLDDSSLDVVVSLETIEHIPKPEKFVQEVVRILKPNGIFYVSTPNDDEFTEGNEYHLHEFTFTELDKLIKKYFKYSNYYYQGTWFASGILNETNFKKPAQEISAIKTFNQPLSKAIYFLALASNNKELPSLDQNAVISDRYSELGAQNNSKHIDATINKLEEDKEKLKNELENVYNSKGWKYLQNARKAKYKIIKPHKNH